MKDYMGKWSKVFVFIMLVAGMIMPSAQFIQAQEFTAGSYEGTSRGYGGDITVEVTVTEDRIVSIEADAADETPGIGDKAIETLTNQVIEGQTLNLDVVSGASGSSNGFLAALALALEAAGADVDALKEKEAESVQEVETIESQTTDVIVIGGGGAGLAAAVSAHENGADVILVEKMPRLGGNTILSGAAYNSFDTERQQLIEMTDLERQTVENLIAEEQEDELVQSWQATLAEEWDAYKASGETYLFDSPSLHKLQTYNGGDKMADPVLVDQLGEKAYEGIEWLESLGMGFNDYMFTVLGGLWTRAHQPSEPLGTGYVNAFTRYFEENSGSMQYFLNTKATDLIIEDNKVVGVIVENNGEKVELRASSVIIATGGFAANVDMREEYNENWASLLDIKTTNHTGATGDGIELGQQINASLVGMSDIQLLPMGDPETGSLSGNIEQGVQDRIFVNSDGNRFVNEGERRDVMTKALFEQEDAMMWTIVDQHSYPTGDTTNNFNETIDELVAEGRAFEADTLEELAELIGVNPDNLVATVDEFNQAVNGEIEDPFGRTLFDNKIDTAPFYAAARKPTVHHTMGGLQINAAAQVLNEDGEVIEGLFAAGEVTGGIHGANRLGGNALADIIVYGRIAGANAANAQNIE
ncbi:flavocytochrome c [Fundicoccus sp. Sow4_H7]|uniref:flavocytochrome c n=1 Tax=Fundicoccus sp. Sow4_H7 TaxID=3438784 RepID=UPI003F931416